MPKTTRESDLIPRKQYDALGITDEHCPTCGGTREEPKHQHYMGLRDGAGSYCGKPEELCHAELMNLPKCPDPFHTNPTPLPEEWQEAVDDITTMAVDMRYCPDATRNIDLMGEVILRKLGIITTALQSLTAERERLENIVATVLLEAQGWAMEAKTQRSTVQRIYQLVTGATGEPGDWHGENPVAALAAERDELREDARQSARDWNALTKENAELRAQLRALKEADDPEPPFTANKYLICVESNLHIAWRNREQIKEGIKR